MGVRITEVDVRYPDVSIYCGPRPDHGQGIKALDDPTVIIEVLSPTTATYDQGTKLEEYRTLASVRLITFVDPVNELVTSHRRIPDGWFVEAAKVRDLELGIASLTIPHAEIFARD